MHTWGPFPPQLASVMRKNRLDISLSSEQLTGKDSASWCCNLRAAEGRWSLLLECEVQTNT